MVTITMRDPPGAHLAQIRKGAPVTIDAKMRDFSGGPNEYIILEDGTAPTVVADRSSARRCACAGSRACTLLDLAADTFARVNANLRYRFCAGAAQ